MSEKKNLKIRYDLYKNEAVTNVQKSAYRNIMKGTAIFGGVQVFNILIMLIRGKIIAVFLGPSGMGVYSLLNSTANTIQQFSSLGLNLSAVKDLSQAHEQHDTAEFSVIILVFRRLLRISGVLGCLISVAFAPYLSEFAFGSRDYTWAFILLAFMLYFTTLSNGEDSILQSSRQLKNLALSTVIGSFAGLVIGIPLYYYWGVKGIVPSMIVLALVSYLAKRYFTRKMMSNGYAITWTETKEKSKGMIMLGIVSMVSVLLGSVAVYLLNAFIRYFGSLNDVGLFQAASSIANQYVGIIFVSMAVDYFPRLAAISADNAKVREVVNRQAEIVLLIVAPLVILLIFTAPLLIRILLTTDFWPVIPLIRWMALGIFFKAASFPLGYISFSKGDKRFFFWMEAITGNLITLGLNMLGYYYGGLAGLGISFFISYGIYYLLIIVATGKRYSFNYDNGFVRLLIPLFFLCLCSFLLTYIAIPVLSYGLQTILLLVVVFYAYKELDKRTGIAQLIAEKFGHR